MISITLFQSTPSGWRETCDPIRSEPRYPHFNPLPPGGGRHQRPPGRARRTYISIHSLRVEGDSFERAQTRLIDNFNPLPPGGGRPSYAEITAYYSAISIHSLRVEGDQGIPILQTQSNQFQSTPSGWRETVISIA